MNQHAYIFPGQGSQFVGMGKDLYENNIQAKEMFEQANKILGFRITDLMFFGTDEDLRQTRVTQPAIFLHSVIRVAIMGKDFRPSMVAGHSLGEFSALVSAGALQFEDGLRLVEQRALAMQQACEMQAGTMAAVLALEDSIVESVCVETEGIVVPANYNCPGQLVISGAYAAVELACEGMKIAGAKRALILPVGGAFHSPLMEPARVRLARAIEATEFKEPMCPVYQNVTASSAINKEEIKHNLVTQLTAPVRWNQSVLAMVSDGATVFTEIGPGKVLQGLSRKIAPQVEAESIA
ncbi:MAG: [acyl-carrier-protein] S-malonyltransferase [Flavobacteriaceae bacterium]|nr:[acyl-carrier-protein] S-malonyltransferase [Flavobacteriaceae bacterium]